MNSELAEFYFAKALVHAGNCDLSAAVGFAAAASGLMPDEERLWELAGLCYYQLGNYEMSEHCLGQLTAAPVNLQRELNKKQDEMKAVALLSEQGKYKAAAAYLKAAAETVAEWNYLGCLYALLGKKDQARGCFEKVLQLDRGNEDALRYLKAIETIKLKKWWQLWG